MKLFDKVANVLLGVVKYILYLDVVKTLKYLRKILISVSKILILSSIGFFIVYSTLYKLNEMDFKLAEIYELNRTIIYYQKNIHKQIAEAVKRDISLLKAQGEITIELVQLKEDILENRLTDNLRMYSTINALEIELNGLKSYIDVQKTEVENRIIKSVYFIYNDSVSAQGSGVLVKYHNQLYVFSVGHMIEGKDDLIYLVEGERRIASLTPIIDDDELDFALFKIDNPEFTAEYYVELADTWENKEEIYICGNPVGIEDMFSEGRIIKERDNYIYFYDHVYYGSSGGGIFNKKGQLIGNISHMKPFQPTPFVPPFVIHGATCLERVICLLKEKGL